ncbi:MAG TPA: hypothetical protein VF941_09610, partial [Clostridia bacterium]
VSDHDKLIEVYVLLKSVQEKIDTFLVSLATKADKTELNDLKKKVELHDYYITQQKSIKNEHKEMSKTTITIIGFIITIISSLVCGLFVYFLSSKGIH